MIQLTSPLKKQQGNWIPYPLIQKINPLPRWVMNYKAICRRYRLLGGSHLPLLDPPMKLLSIRPLPDLPDPDLYPPSSHPCHLSQSPIPWKAPTSYWLYSGYPTLQILHFCLFPIFISFFQKPFPSFRRIMRKMSEPLLWIYARSSLTSMEIWSKMTPSRMRRGDGTFVLKLFLPLPLWRACPYPLQGKQISGSGSPR